jgi:hypothetical protein
VDVEVAEAEHPSPGQKDNGWLARTSTVQIEGMVTSGVPVSDRGQVERIR